MLLHTDCCCFVSAVTLAVCISLLMTDAGLEGVFVYYCEITAVFSNGTDTSCSLA